MAGIPIPKPSFLDECISSGARNGSKRWRSENGKRLYTWDSLHGEIEVFNAQGYHLGVLDAEGNFIKPAVKGRKIDV
ncbi:colicin E3/pyocin S6 family cytotoxin [Ferruginibacter sp.]